MLMVRGYVLLLLDGVNIRVFVPVFPRIYLFGLPDSYHFPTYVRIAPNFGPQRLRITADSSQYIFHTQANGNERKRGIWKETKTRPSKRTQGETNGNARKRALRFAPFLPFSDVGENCTPFWFTESAHNRRFVTGHFSHTLLHRPTDNASATKGVTGLQGPYSYRFRLRSETQNSSMRVDKMLSFVNRSRLSTRFSI